MKKSNSFISWLIAFSIITSCDKKFQLKEFDSNQWKNDSVACNGYRKSNYGKIYEQKGDIIGMKEEIIIKNLGEPNSKNETNYFYFVSSGLQCQDSIKVNIDSIDIKVIVFQFDNNRKVKSVQVHVP